MVDDASLVLDALLLRTAGSVSSCVIPEHGRFNAHTGPSALPPSNGRFKTVFRNVIEGFSGHSCAAGTIAQAVKDVPTTRKKKARRR
jgi:hypothetical protein